MKCSLNKEMILSETIVTRHNVSNYKDNFYKAKKE